MEVFKLSFRAEELYANLLPDFVEKICLHHHLQLEQAVHLRLAAEEIVAYLATNVPKQEISLTLEVLPIGIQLNLSFEVDPDALRFFNFVVDPEHVLESDESISHLGLLLAANAVDHYTMFMEKGLLEIKLLKEFHFELSTAKTYKDLEKAIDIHSNQKMTLGLLDEISSYIQSSYHTEYYNQNICKPNRAFAQIETGEYDYSMVFDEAGKVLGFMYWSKKDKNCYEFFGPYVFCQKKDEVSEILSRQMVEKCAKSNVHFLFSEKATKDLYEPHFESVSLSKGSENKIYYRQLKEDMGASVWGEEGLMEYLNYFYDELILFRDIKDAGKEKLEANKYSVFTVEPDHIRSIATIIPYLSGKDALENIIAHIRVLQKEGFTKIRARFDLYAKWQAQLASLFAQQGFKSLYLKPHGGMSDVLFMEYHED